MLFPLPLFLSNISILLDRLQVLGHELCLDAGINSRYQNLLDEAGYTILPFLFSLSVGNRQYSCNSKSIKDSSGTSYNIASREKKLSFLNYRIGYMLSTPTSSENWVPKTSTTNDINNLEGIDETCTFEDTNQSVRDTLAGSRTIKSQWQAGASLEHHFTLLYGGARNLLINIYIYISCFS